MPVRWPDARRLRRLAGAVVGLLAVAAGAAQEGVRPGLDVGTVLGGEGAEGFERAVAPRDFVFPEDHGPHPAFRSEWWYLTAHLRDAAGRPFGVQFTLFRQALVPPAERAGGAAAPEPASAWRTGQVWMAHVALGAPDSGHQAAQRFSRGALGLAGVQAAPFAAWLEDWRLTTPAEVGPFPLELELAVDEAEPPFTVRLRLEAEKAPVPQGENGLSRKSAREGNASHYYSFTRIEASGEIVRDGRAAAVSGLAWLDREWSTSALDPGQAGWDWFALHLEDGRDLMLYRIRRGDGSVDPASAGTLVGADGSVRRLGPADWSLEPERFWSDGAGGRWPVAWRLAVPAAGVDGRVRAVRDDALNRLAVRYWEGMVCLEGTASGCGFLELTGYGDADRDRAGRASPD
jgi:predicted secreted hydrolase